MRAWQRQNGAWLRPCGWMKHHREYMHFLQPIAAYHYLQDYDAIDNQAASATGL